MNKDNEPILSDFTIASDDHAHRSRAARAAARPASPETMAEATTTSGGNALAVWAFLLVLALAGVAAFLFLQLRDLQQSFASAQQQIQAQGESANLLNEKLSVTGENTSTSMGALQAQNREQDSEIRKLWDLAGKRNRNAIEAQGKDLAQLEAANKRLDKELAQLQQKIESVTKLNSELDQRIHSTESRLLEMTELELRVAQQGETMQQNTKELTNEIAKTQKTAQELEKLRLQVNGLNARLERAATGASKQ